MNFMKTWRALIGCFMKLVKHLGAKKFYEFHGFHGNSVASVWTAAFYRFVKRPIRGAQVYLKLMKHIVVSPQQQYIIIRDHGLFVGGLKLHRSIGNQQIKINNALSMDASSLTLEYLSSVLLEHLYNCMYILYIVMLQSVIVQ